MAGDFSHIRAALLKPRFSRLPDIALEFGPDRLRAEWLALRAAALPEVDRAAKPVERCLHHIEEGLALAARGN